MFDLIGRVMAQTPLPTPPTGPTTGAAETPILHFVPTGTELDQWIVSIITWALTLVGLIAVIYLVYGGIQYITAGGDAEKATKGRTTIINAIIGIVVVALSFAIVQYVGNSVD